MIAGLVDLYIAEACSGKINETPSTYRSKLKRFDQWLQLRGLCLEALDDQLLDQFRRSLLERKEKWRGAKMVKAQLSPFTIHTCLMTVRGFLAWAYRRGHISCDLAAGMNVPKAPEPEPKAIDANTVMQLLEAASETGDPWEQARNLALIYLLRDTGGRIGSVICADIDDLDLQHGKLFVIAKGGKPRNLYLNPPTIAAIRTWLRYRPQLRPQDRKLLLSCRGRGLARSSVYSLIARIKQHTTTVQGRANPHAYRHAWARDALTAGMDISKVAATLGNSVRVTAEYYARWNDAELKRAHRHYSPGADLPLIEPKDAGPW